MGLSENTGFFTEYYLKIKVSQTADFDKELEELKKCSNEWERISFVEELPWVKECDNDIEVHRSFSGKDSTTAADFKEKGNVAFMNKKWLEAMLLYTKSYIALPQDLRKEKAIVLANRSASLYHLQKYDETLIDIKRSLDLGYPKDKQYKLFERQARCFIAKHDYPSTIAAFKKCISGLDDATLPAEKRSKITLDAMTMIKMLEKDPRTAKQAEKQKKAVFINLPSMVIPEEKEYLSESICFEIGKDCGRFARAASSIQMGEEILVEKPFVAVLLERYSKTHCENCFMRTVIPVACSRCADVVYCSENCLEIAANSYHKYECGILPTIWRSGASVNCHMALRLIASRPLDYFLSMADQLNELMPLEKIQKLSRNDYRRVSHLVRHEESRSSTNFFHHVLMARFLLKCLQAGGYFINSTQPNDFLKISGLLLRNIEFVQFNTHEVAELHVSKDHTKKNTIFVGGAIYPTLALFNHSCDPGIVRFFRGTTIHVNTIKPIESGLEISENYGPIYTQETRDVRKAKLKDLYWFDCTCDPCLENWPTFDKLPTDVIRFRCDAPNKCSAVIEVPADCNDFMITCGTCGEATNIFKGLKVMQDTEVMTRTALRYYESGDYTKALNKYIDLVRIMFEVLAPPFPDFCQVQQHAKDCFLHFGNVYSLE